MPHDLKTDFNLVTGSGEGSGDETQLLKFLIALFMVVWVIK